MFVAPGERIPGPRPDSLMGSIDFPWREVVDASEDVTAKAAYRTSMELSRSGILVGPSSGMTLCGLYKYLQRAKDAGTLDQHRDSEGQIVCK